MSTPPRPPITIAILDDQQDAAARYFPTDGLRGTCDPQVTIYTDHVTGDELISRAGAAEVVVVMRERSVLSREVIERLDATRLIITSGPHNSAIDLAAARERGITVSGTRGKDAAPAELAWGLLLALIRRIPAEDAGIRAGRWGVHVGDTLEGRRLGVLGLGDLGTRIARYGRAFGMEVLAHSRSLTREYATMLGCSAVTRDTLFRESDVLSVNLRLTPETRASVSEREFGLMKRTAVIVNTARGQIIDETALIAALRAGTIAGAALDVFEHEPLPASSSLRELDNVVMTPHIGYVSDERYRSYFTQAAEIIAEHVQGRSVRQLL